MDAFSTQLTTLILLCLGSLLFGFLPLCCVKLVSRLSDSDQEWRRRTKVATFLLYFGGGVLMSDSFLVLLPKARHKIDFANGNVDKSSSQNEHQHDNFPIPEFLVVCSFFGAYILQEILYAIFIKINKIPRRTSDVRVRFCSCAKRHTECSRTFKDARPDQTLYGLEKNLTESAKARDLAVGPVVGTSEAAVTAKSDLLRSSIIAQTVPNYGTVTNVAEPIAEAALPVLTPPVLLEEERLALQHTQTSNYNTFLISSMLTVLGLTLQCIFLGMNMGHQAMFENIWPYLVVVSLQNFILIFSSGSELVAGNLELSYIAMCVAVLSCISPLGIIAAMCDDEVVRAISDLAKGIVASVACGTLLYTTFYQMLRQRRHGSVYGLTKFFAIAFGASVMTALNYGIIMLQKDEIRKTANILKYLR